MMMMMPVIATSDIQEEGLKRVEFMQSYERIERKPQNSLEKVDSKEASR